MRRTQPRVAAGVRLRRRQPERRLGARGRRRHRAGRLPGDVALRGPVVLRTASVSHEVRENRPTPVRRHVPTFAGRRAIMVSTQGKGARTMRPPGRSRSHSSRSASQPLVWRPAERVLLRPPPAGLRFPPQTRRQSAMVAAVCRGGCPSSLPTVAAGYELLAAFGPNSRSGDVDFAGRPLEVCFSVGSLTVGTLSYKIGRRSAAARRCSMTSTPTRRPCRAVSPTRATTRARTRSRSPPAVLEPGSCASTNRTDPRDRSRPHPPGVSAGDASCVQV